MDDAKKIYTEMTGLRQHRKRLIFIGGKRKMHLFITFISDGKSDDGHIFELVKLNVISCLCKFVSQVFCVISLS